MLYLMRYPATMTFGRSRIMAPDLAAPTATHTDVTLAQPTTVAAAEAYRHVLPEGASSLQVRRYANRRAMLRGSGVASPASASFATVLASHCARAVLADGSGPPVPRDTLGVVLGSALAALDPAHRLELCGLREGWDLIDPFSFPHTLPSSCAASVAAAVGGRAFAFACRDNALASLRAVHLATTAILHGRAKHVLVGGTEEASDFVLALLAASRRPDFLSAPGAAPCVPITEVAVVGLLERAGPESDPGTIALEGYGELTGEVTDADAERFRGAFVSGAPGCFDLALVNAASQHPVAAKLRSTIATLCGRPPVIFHVAGQFGDTHGAAGAVALAVLAARPPGTRALVLCAGRDGRLGLLVANRPSKAV